MRPRSPVLLWKWKPTLLPHAGFVGHFANRDAVAAGGEHPQDQPLAQQRW
jgi:hypothetical protein